MKIHYFSGEGWEEEYVKAKLPNEEITFHEGPLASFPDLTDPEAEVLCTFIESKIGEDEMKRFPALKLIATRSTGFDHIDLAAAKARGVSVTNVPFYGENTVAEFAFALLLALSRKIIDADERVRETGTFSHDNLRGFDLAGKTIGVVGCGHIGVHVIRMANGFGMKVLGFDVNKNDELAESLNFT
ncbi:MAG: NAD(P)-dependent oxidoreductase, partial [Patescibacteria group bacterium]